MDLAYAHIMAPNARFKENYARIAPGSHIVETDSTDNFLLAGPESELESLCRRCGGHPVRNLSTSFEYTSYHSSLMSPNLRITRIDNVKTGEPGEVIKFLNAMIGNPWKWLLQNQEGIYLRHKSPRGLLNKEKMVTVPADVPNFVVELSDGIHSFVVHERYGL